jgi:hypothetical protein
MVPHFVKVASEIATDISSYRFGPGKPRKVLRMVVSRIDAGEGGLEKATCTRLWSGDLLMEVIKLGRVHTNRSASTMRANDRKPRKRTSSFSKREKMRRNPLSLRNSRSISLSR